MYHLFDPGPYLSALALIRVPRTASASFKKPAPDDDFGTGFFVTSDGVLLTVAHNLTRTGTPDGELLPWVWVCCFNHVTKDWTDAVRASVDPSLVDRNLDAAVLVVPLFRLVAPLTVAADWAKGDSIAVLGFQPDGNRASGFDVHWLPSAIPYVFPVAPFDLRGEAREPALRLVPVDGALGKGISGGPALNLDREGSPAIAIEKAEVEGFELRSPEIKTTAIHWMRSLLDRVPHARGVRWLPPRDLGGHQSDVRRGSDGTPATRQASPRPVPPPAPASSEHIVTAGRSRRVLRTVLLIGITAGAWTAALVPWWRAVEADVVGPLSIRVVRVLAAETPVRETILATDAVVRDAQGPVIELTRRFNRHATGHTGFGRGWGVFVPFSMEAESADTTRVLGNLIGPRRIRATNHATGTVLILAYEDRELESGYFGEGLEPFRRLAIQTNGGFFLEADANREVQFDPALRPIVADFGPGMRWVYQYTDGRLAAIHSLPERIRLDAGTEGGAIAVIDRLNPATLRFVSEEDGLRRFQPDEPGRWSHATINQRLVIGLHDRWGYEFIFQGPDRFIILDGPNRRPGEEIDGRDGGITFVYDSLGRIERARIGHDPDVRYEYDDEDRLVAVIASDGHRVRYGYDANGMPYRKMSILTQWLRGLLCAVGLLTAVVLIIPARLQMRAAWRRWRGVYLAAD